VAGIRIEFRILGPLAVRIDGGPVPIGGPKQRALLALLLLSANRVVSRERLVGELFAEQSVNSADHALRNHVSRLRKILAPAALGEPRLVARAPGYLLRIEPGELDFEQFERLLAAGREAAGASDPRKAAELLQAAERLWAGKPFADLELEPYARVEAERLEELRLAAVEERIDAELALGRHLALVAELDSLAAEHPYRERFRAQLMLALYRSGRQAEGLDVYRRTRSFLNEELGLEPGVELQELERAILVQDPALALRGPGVAPVPAPLRDVCPFKGLAPFEPEDAELFFGRERLVDELVARIADVPVFAIVGASGSGKSSLLRAGLLPALGDDAILVRPADLFTSGLAEPGERTVLAVDQFEELFSGSIPEPERGALVDQLVEAAWDPDRRVRILIALRADFFGRLAQYPELADLVGPNHVLLGPMSPSELRRAIEGPAERAGLTVEPALVDALIDDVAGEPGGLPLLSTALLDLWDAREGETLTRAAYEQTGGVRGAVGRHAEAGFRSLPVDERDVARRILLRLVAGGDGEALTRRRVTRAELDADEDERVDRVLAALVTQRLLVADSQTVELVHEALLERWPRLARWVEEDAQGRRLHRQLTQAALDWDAGGRRTSDLFHGARLAATLEWADSAGEHVALNRLERAFLEASRIEFARANRRLRALLAVAVALLAAALAAGAVALTARNTARNQETAATAERLGAQALADPALDRSLLLAREGVALDDSLATRSNLLAALVKSPAAIAVVHGSGQRVLDAALSSDGRLLALRGNDSGVVFFDARTLRERGPRYSSAGQLSYFGAIVRPVRSLAFSPDGFTLAVGDSDGRAATLTLLDAKTHTVHVSVTSSRNVATADVAFAPDGRTLVTGEAVTGRRIPPDEVLVLRSASNGVELRRSKAIPGGRLVGFTADGRFLLVTSGEKTSFLLDPKTFARVRTFRASGAGAISPAGSVAAFGQNDGSVQLVDLHSGTLRPLGRATSKVVALAFSRDGKLLATGSDDGTVDIWDVSPARLRETFVGHSGAAVALVFSRDGATLYSGSSDGSAIAWDVAGRRRLGRPFRFSPLAGDAPTAVAVSPDGQLIATQPSRNRVTLWRASDLTAVRTLRGPGGLLDSLAFSHNGRLLAAAGDARDTVVWSVATGRIVRLLGPAGAGGATGVNFSPDDHIVGTAGVDGNLRLYDLPIGRQIARIKIRGSLQDVDFSSDGKRVVAAGLAGDIAVWNLGERRLERLIHTHDAVFAIRLSPDGREIVTGSINGEVQFWDLATGRQVGRTIGGQSGAVVSVSYDPTGQEVMTTSSDGKFRLWDIASGKLVGAPLPGSDTSGWGTYFPDGKHVIAVFRSGIGVVWNINPAAWDDQACRIAHRNLTRTEWRDLLPGRGYTRTCP
jgi:WD40 repeat protein/DNA-binding SARP family transcriptional activator